MSISMFNLGGAKPCPKAPETVASTPKAPEAVAPTRKAPEIVAPTRKAPPPVTKGPENVHENDEDTSSATYRIQCGAMLLTWNFKEVTRPTWEDFEQDFQQLLSDKDVVRASVCFEHGSCDHIHAFLEKAKGKWDCSKQGFAMFGVSPNVRPNTGKGSAARPSKDRGHFYVFCPYKDTHEHSWTNYHPGHDYKVPTQWVQNLYQTGMVTKRPIECAAEYHSLTPAFEALVRLSDGKRRAVAKAAERSEREQRIRAKFTSFNVPPHILEWKKQYDEEQLRYHFLVIHGPSQTRKTEFARSLFKNAFLHRDSIAWVGYNEDEHDAVIFDDIKCIYKFVSDNRALFQAGGPIVTQTSATNVHALTVDLTAKPLIITSNDAPTGEWLLANAVLMEVTSPLA